ncbi:unnamed protein product [Thlaspi arvense]|uniref:RRM domain-containing protein n=1 Tax=Thlaspi arvense TaxID=13288 RepID=A0AAU9T1I8_THLAR|nr:unnamed protein product [Thlaspi arvense]
MDGSTIKGDVELNDSDAGTRKSSSMMSRIYVEGYDTLLPGKVVAALKKHFASCGEVIYVYIPGYVWNTTRLNSFALIYLRGEGAEEKALKLSGSKMRGRMLVAEAYPFHAKHLDSVLSPMRVLDNKRCHVRAILFLEGEDALEKALQLSGCDVVKGLENIEVSGVAAPQNGRDCCPSTPNFPFKSRMNTTGKKIAKKKKKKKNKTVKTTEWKTLS